jgi:hypothetical protein
MEASASAACCSDGTASTAALASSCSAGSTPRGAGASASRTRNVQEGASAVHEQLAIGLPRAEILPVIPLGTALGVHTGAGCVVVAAQELS